MKDIKGYKSNDDTKTAVVVSSLQKRATPIFKKLPDVIKTKEEYEDAVANMKLLKAMAKEAEEERKAIIAPLAAVIDRIKALFLPFETKVGTAEKELKAKMSTYLAASKTKAAAIGSALDTGKIKNVATAVRRQNALIPTTSNRMVWQVVEIDASKTPRQYLMPDTKAIKEELKSGGKVAGWKWEQVEQIVI